MILAEQTKLARDAELIPRKLMARLAYLKTIPLAPVILNPLQKQSKPMSNLAYGANGRQPSLQLQKQLALQGPMVFPVSEQEIKIILLLLRRLPIRRSVKEAVAVHAEMLRV